jgi:hypothetical protein
MGLVLGFIFLFCFALSLIATGLTASYQQKLRKNMRGSSWRIFLLIAFLLTVSIGWLGAGLWPESHGGAPTGRDYEWAAWSTLVLTLAPGFGFISAYVYSRTR